MQSVANMSTLVPWTPCLAQPFEFPTDREILSCDLSTELYASIQPSYNVSVYVRVTRAGIQQKGQVGVIGQPFSLPSRAEGAKVARNASSYLIPLPAQSSGYRDSVELVLQGARLLFCVDSNRTGENCVPSSRKRLVTDGDVGGSCAARGDSSRRPHPEFAECSSDTPLSWADGYLFLVVYSFPYVPVTSVYMGQIVDNPTVASNSAKIAAISGVEITLTGSNFADGPFVAIDNVVSVKVRENDCDHRCTPVRATATRLVARCFELLSAPCNFSDLVPQEVVLSYFSSWGRPLEVTSRRTQVGTLVPPPTATVFMQALNLSNRHVRLDGNYLADVPTDNIVRASTFQGNASVGVDCQVLANLSTPTTLFCRLSDESLVATPNQLLFFSVFANGAWTAESIASVYGNYTPVVILYSPTAAAEQLPPPPVDDSTTRAAIGAGVGVSLAALTAAAILAFFFLRRRRRIEDMKGQLHNVPEAFASMFNIKAADLEIIKKLGEGSFGAVFLARYNSPKGTREVAVKKLTSSMLSASVDGFFREAVRLSVSL